MHPRFVLPWFSAICLQACAGAPADNPHLADSQWRFVAIDGARPASADAVLGFDGDRLGINVGCNGMGGPWRVENGRLIAGPLIATQMYCDGPVWDQEKAIGALIAGAPQFRVDATRMTLSSSGHSAELERVEPPDD